MHSLNDLLATGRIPDSAVRFGIRRRLATTLKEYVHEDPAAARQSVLDHARGLRDAPIAINTADANEQHYEVPTEFYQLCLGPRLKYSSGFCNNPSDTLAQAEENMLALTCEHADLHDGQRVLELGCGWGSLTLWMAEKYPNSEITAVSNSATQKKHIDAQAKQRGLNNVTIRTADMNAYAGEGDNVFDRAVSVEMFEHMKNYQELMRRISAWLKPGGTLFVHIFTHRTAAYHYEVRDDSDWMAKYFFTGGQMPSDDLLLYFQDDLKIVDHWALPGTHYQHTAEAWLTNMDANEDRIRTIFDATYGPENTTKWWHYWRIFYMACAELWGYENGTQWLVSHYRFQKPA